MSKTAQTASIRVDETGRLVDLRAEVRSERLVTRLREPPGVEAVGLAAPMPVTGSMLRRIEVLEVIL